MAQVMDFHEAQTPEPASADSLFDFVGILWRRKWIALVMLVACGALGALYFFQAERVYQSSAQILLIKKEKFPVAGNDAGRGPGRYSEYGYEDTLSTHMILITSPLIVGRAVESHKLASLTSFRPENPDPADDPAPRVTRQIIAGLKASRGGEKSAPDPNVMNLSFEGTDPGDCQTVVNAVIDSYQKFLGETYQNFSAETVQLITQAKDELSRQLSEKETAYRKFRQESPLAFGGKGQEAANLHETRGAEIEKARSSLLVELARTRSLMEGVQAAIKRGANREAITLLIRNSERIGQAQRADLNPADRVEMMLLDAVLNEEDLLDAYGPDHPKVKTAQRRTAALREKFGAAPSTQNSGGADFLKVYLDALAEELKLGQQRSAELDKLFEEERRASKALMAVQHQDETIRSDLNRTQQTFDAVIKRLQEINLVKDYGGVSMQLLAEPQIGGLVKPKMAMVLALAVLAGLGLGVGMAYLVEIADRSFRSPEDVRSQLGLPVLGHIPVMSSRPKGKAAHNGDGKAEPALDPMLYTFHHPKGRPAEAYRAVRTALYFGTAQESHKVIQVTSPGPGDGKTTLAANLAVAIADSGKKVLLVDADFRRPRIGKLLGLDGTAGLGSLFAGDVELSDLVQQTAVENLWAIPCGPRPHNPADLLTSSQFKDFIEVVREKYDFVIVDSPPVLAVTDPSAIAPRVDGVLFVLRLSKHAREAALRATETIATVGGRILGLVVNGVSDRQGYGYGKYGYRRYGYGRYGYKGYGKDGYGYGHGYGYSYGYHYQETDEPGSNGHANGKETGEDSHARSPADSSSRPVPTKASGKD